MSLSRGPNVYAGFGAEVTVGTKGTIDLFHRIVDCSFKHQKDLFASESLEPDWQTELYYTAGRNIGSIVFEQGYTGLELWFHALLGSYSYTVNSPVSGANTHVFSFAAATNNHPALSVERIVGIGGTKEAAFLGVRPMKATIEFGPRKPMRTTFECVGLGTSRSAATAPTFVTPRRVLPSHKSVLTANGTALSILSGRIEMNVPRADDREHYGDPLYKDAVVVGQPTASFQFEAEFGDDSGADTDAILALYEAGTKLSGLVLTHQGDIVVGSTKYTNTITGGGAYIEDATPTTFGQKVTGVTISGRITNSLTVTFINATAQVT